MLRIPPGFHGPLTPAEVADLELDAVVAVCRLARDAVKARRS